LPLFAGVNYWTGGGPEGGEVGLFAFAPAAPSIVYAVVPGGVLFKSTDAGSSWRMISHEGFRHLGQPLVVAPNDPSTVYAVSSTRGLLKTTDGGTTWRLLFPFRRTARYGLATNPNRPEYVYVVEGDLDGRPLSLLISTDAGTSWDRKSFPTGVNGLEALSVTGSNPQVIYALAARLLSDSTQRLFLRSTDGGSTWVQGTLPPISMIEVDRADNRIIYGAHSREIWRSTNGGDTWAVSLDLPSISGVLIRIDPGKPGRVYATAANALYRTENSGVTWELVKPIELRTFMVLGNGILLGSTNTRVVKSVDGGSSWSDSVAGMAGVNVIDKVFPVFAGDGKIVYTYTSWSEFFKSTDRGGSWTEIKTPSGKVRAAQSRPGVLYTVNQSFTFYRSDDDGANWTQLYQFDSGLEDVDVLVSPYNENRIYATLTHRFVGGPWGFGTYDTYLASTDGGKTWTEAKGLPAAFHPTIPDTWWTVTNHVLKTTDNGATLQQLTAFPDSVGGVLRVNPQNPGVLYLGSSKGLHRSTNGGSDWQPTGLQNYAWTFDLDPEKPSRLLAFTSKSTDLVDPDGNHYLQTENAVLKSEDHGDTWSPFDEGLLFSSSSWPPPVLAFGKGHSAYLANGGPRGGLYSIVVDDSLFYPQVTSAATGLFTGLAFVNLNGSSVQASVQARSQDGSVIQMAGMTNPATVTVSSGYQWVSLAATTFGSAFEKEPVEGWARISGLQGETTSFFSMGCPDLDSLDTADVGSRTMMSFVFPEITAKASDTRLRIANPNDSPVEITLTLLGADGKPLGQPASRTIAASGVLIESLSEMFGSLPTPETYVRVQGGLPVVPLEQIGDAHVSIAALHGQDRGTTRLYSPQYAVGEGDVMSEVSIINLDRSEGQVEVRFVGDDGAQFGTTKMFTISGGGKIHLADETLFGPSTSLRNGYLDIKSDGIRLAGSVVFGDPSGKLFRSVLPLVQASSKSLVYSHLVSSQDFFTGLALLNAGQATANVRLEVFSRQGQSLAVGQVILPPGSRRSQLLTEYLPGLKGIRLDSGYIRLTSDEPIHSFALFGAFDLRFLAAVPGQTYE